MQKENSKRVYVIELEKDTDLPATELGLKTIEACRFSEWMYPSRDILWATSHWANGEISLHTEGNISEKYLNTSKSLLDQEVGAIIPVGSIDFVEGYLSTHDRVEHIHPINIPRQLKNKTFTKRNLWSTCKEKLPILLSREKAVFIKSASVCKEFEPMEITLKTLQNYDIPCGQLLASEVISIRAEWRVLVHRGNIVGCRMYSGSWERGIDKTFVYSCVEAYTDCPPSYALDIAELSSGGFAVIEVSNFISCGIYGADNPIKLLNMLSSGIRYEIDRATKGTRGRL